MKSSQQPSPIDSARFRQAMSRFASGVTVVTTALDDRLAGLTVSSFSSLSLNPPLVLICVDLLASGHDAIIAAGRFAVNILAEDQAEISQRFATHQSERFLPGTYQLSRYGLPLISGAIAQIECELHASLPGGDHTIFVGRVLDAKYDDRRPLLYFRSGYQHLG